MLCRTTVELQKKSIKNPIKPPINDEITAILKALAAFPWQVIGYPSNVVGTDAGVPGIFSKIAVISPPDTPPIYIPNRRERD